MPIFRTTQNIFTDFSEYFDENWLDSDHVVLPDTQEWSYDRELDISDIDLWEVITEFSGGGVYAAWKPHAEFYMVVLPKWAGGVQTFYGLNCLPEVKQYLKLKQIPVKTQNYHPYYSNIEITPQGIKNHNVKNGKRRNL